MRLYFAQKNPALTDKRYSCRLSLSFAASLEALFGTHLQTLQPRFLSDLLRLGMVEVRCTQVVGNLVQPVSQPDRQQLTYLLTGPFSAFRKLSYLHQLALKRAGAKVGELQLGNTAGYQLGNSASME